MCVINTFAQSVKSTSILTSEQGPDNSPPDTSAVEGSTNGGEDDFPNFLIEGGYIFDAKAIKGWGRDAVKFINMTSVDGLTFDVYFYTQKQDTWVLYGMALTKEYYNIQKVESPYEDIIGSFRYFAIVATCEGDFRYDVKKVHHDIYVYVYPKEDFTLSQKERDNATILDVAQIAGSFTGDIKFINSTKGAYHSFWVYAFNDEDEPWQRVGLVTLGKPGKKTLMRTPIQNISDYEYIVLSNRENKSFVFDALIKHGSLIISVK